MANTEHILVLDGLEPFFSASQEQTSYVGGDSFQLGLLDAVLFLDLLLAEFSKISVSDGEEDDTPTQQGWSLLAAIQINHSQIKQIHAQDPILPIYGSQLQVLFHIPAACHSLDLKIQQDQYLTLHGQYLLEGVLPATGLIVMPQFRDLDFFVLRSHEDRSDSQELVPASRDLLPEAVFIDYEDCEVEGVSIAAQALVDLDDPRHQRFSHGGCQLGLARHEVLRDVGFVLKVKSMGVYFLEVGLHLGQRLEPLGREGGFSGFMPGLFGELGRGEVGEVEAEGARRVSGLNGAGLRRTVHSLNLTLTAISKEKAKQAHAETSLELLKWKGMSRPSTTLPYFPLYIRFLPQSLRRSSFLFLCPQQRY